MINKSHNTIRLLLIDDHPVLRCGIKQLVGTDPQLQVVAEASDGEQGISLAQQYKPDLVLLDIKMPGISGLETLEQLKLHGLCQQVVILSGSDQEEDVIGALKKGADGYLLKNMEPEAVLTAIHQIVAGKITVTESLTPLLVARLRHSPNHSSATSAALTHREYDILKLIALGLSNKLIARRLMLSENTVKVHVKHVLRKLQLKSRVEAAIWFLQKE